MKEWRLHKLPFGVNCSSYILLAVLQQHISRECEDASPMLKQGDAVFVVNDRKRQSWRLARVLTLYAGKDGKSCFVDSDKFWRHNASPNSQARADGDCRGGRQRCRRCDDPSCGARPEAVKQADNTSIARQDAHMCDNCTTSLELIAP